MRRKLLKVWYAVLIILVVEVVAYGLTGYMANVFRTVAINRFNENAKIFHDVHTQVPYAELINRYGRLAGINPEVIAAIIQVESSFQPRVVSPAGAYGLMQIMPKTWSLINKELKVCSEEHGGACSSECYFNAELNIHIGTQYLGNLLKKYQGNMILAVAAYNAGPGAVDLYGGIPPYPETMKYTETVVEKFYYLQHKKKYHSIIFTPDLWAKVHKWIGWSFIVTMIVVVLIVRRLVRDQSSWYWR